MFKEVSRITEEVLEKIEQVTDIKEYSLGPEALNINTLEGYIRVPYHILESTNRTTWIQHRLQK